MQHVGERIEPLAVADLQSRRIVGDYGDSRRVGCVFGQKVFYIYTMCAVSERAFAVRFFSIDKNRVLAESIDCDARFYIRGVADIE